MKNLPWVASVTHRPFDDPDWHHLRIFDSTGAEVMCSHFEDFENLLGVLLRFDRRMLAIDDPKILRCGIKRHIPEVPYQFNWNTGELNLTQTVQVIAKHNPTYTSTQISNITGIPRAAVTAAMKVKT